MYTLRGSLEAESRAKRRGVAVVEREPRLRVDYIATLNGERRESCKHLEDDPQPPQPPTTPNPPVEEPPDSPKTEPDAPVREPERNEPKNV